MRWKAHFFLSKREPSSSDKFGLPSKAFAPPIPQMKAFEEELLKLTSNITFRKVNDQFLNKINNIKEYTYNHRRQLQQITPRKCHESL